MDTHDVAPGVYDGMKAKDYHKARAVSKSRLDRWNESTPKHYHYDYLDDTREPEEESAPTDAQIIGDACHAAILEPDTFEERYITAPADAPKRPTKAQINAKMPSPDSVAAIRYWLDFDEEHADKTILKRDHIDIALRTRDSVLRHPEAGPLLSGGVAERSYFAIDPVTGLAVKVRPDYLILPRKMIVDLKSTRCANEEEFGRSAENYRYHVQGAFYPDVVELHEGAGSIIDFAFVAFEKDPPYAVGIYYMTPEDFEDGSFEYREDLDAIAQHTAMGVWPDEGMNPRGLKRPYWAKSKRRRNEEARRDRFGDRSPTATANISF